MVGVIGCAWGVCSRVITDSRGEGGGGSVCLFGGVTSQTVWLRCFLTWVSVSAVIALSCLSVCFVSGDGTFLSALLFGFVAIRGNRWSHGEITRHCLVLIVIICVFGTEHGLQARSLQVSAPPTTLSTTR